ncbi:MAG: hypothetical protein M3P31_02590 [Actinomycetota bacterium]|nr:hypothetical protein [Actinomycetota bacterium]
MRRPALRLATCVLAGAATVLVAAPAASADPVHQPGHELPGTSSAPLNAPPLTVPHGRKLG